ncbi:DUF4118 domain-containing protein [Nocardioides sp. Soil805]|uniref:DUF4118 domain-containing protein n=1 Tax=Nocardioides sp. Soil805 TaxID=1736416 RepID=UPI000703AEC6|nr:DUF4118 domain-containing protein [Nocardioides sp. Soil805]KRF37635.1 hypothetical protein ASG94_10155 [Nocardioides sp. Soil805]
MSVELAGGPRTARWRTVVRVAAIIGPFLTCAALSAFRDEVTAATAVLVMVVWVVAAAASGDRWAGVIAALSGGAWFDFFLTEPYHRFTISSADDAEATILLVVISLAVTEVSLWGHRQQVQASRRSGYLDGVLGAARAVSMSDVPDRSVIDVVARQIAQVLTADSCHFVGGPVHDPRVAVLDDDGALIRNGREVDVERVGLPSDEYVAVPVRRGAHQIGHFLVGATARVAYPTREQRRVAVLLAAQVAPAAQGRSG